MRRFSAFATTLLPNTRCCVQKERMKIVVFALILLCTGCASYVTPGAAVRLQDIDRPDIAAAAARKASPNFPARLAIVRVQAPEYRSHSSESYGNGRFSVLTTQELLTESAIQNRDPKPKR